MGVDPLVPTPQRIRVPRATEATIRATFKRQNGAPLDLTLGSVALGVTLNPSDFPILVIPGVVFGLPIDGIADFSIVRGDTSGVRPTALWWDLHYTDPDGFRSAVIPFSPFVLDASATYP